MKTVKVTKTETYKDSQGEHIVCKGKLILLKLYDEDIKNGNYKAIIVSEIEKIEVGDMYLRSGQIGELKDFEDNVKYVNDRVGQFGFRKILALPENFSPEILKDIVDGKLKDGDEVFVECEEILENDVIDNGTNYKEFFIKQIKLNKDNHIKLFPINKEESWDEIMAKYIKYAMHVKITANSFQNLSEWLEENYNPPTKIN